MGVVYSRPKPMHDREVMCKTINSAQDTVEITNHGPEKDCDETSDSPFYSALSNIEETAIDCDGWSTEEQVQARGEVEIQTNPPVDPPPDIQPSPEKMETDLNETSVVQDMDEEFTPPRFSTPLRDTPYVNGNGGVVNPLSSSKTRYNLRTVRRSVFPPPSYSSTSSQTDAFSINESRVIQLERDPEETVYSDLKDSGKGSLSQGKRTGRPLTRKHVENVIMIKENPPMYQCKVCKKQFKTKWHSHYHEFCGKEGPLPFKCDSCELGFRTKGHLQYHLRTKHNMQIEVRRNFSCSRCPMKFAFLKQLEKHLTQHSTSNVGSCSENNGVNTINGNIDGNVASSDLALEERQYECHKCKKRFKRSDHRSRHFKKCRWDEPTADEMRSQP